MSSPRSAFAPTNSERADYNIALGYLRAFVTVLVVAHHAVLAYCTFSPPPPVSLIAQPRLWLAFPVTDPHKWLGFDVLVAINDIFFMSLMFFLSGLFVWQSLQRKGAGKFVRDRVLRLGVPFLVSAAVVAPLAYVPTYLQMTGPHDGFMRQWLGLGIWPAGPAWFVWVLLAFDCIAAALLFVSPKWGEKLGHALSGSLTRPFAFFGVVVAVSLAAYLPMLLRFGPMDWFSVGPFFLQKSRALHYLAYFLLGVGAGAWGIDRGILARGSKLARRWPLWLGRALLMFAVTSWVGLTAMTPQGLARPYLWGSIYGVAFTLCCAAWCFALLAFFLRFTKRPRPLFDSLRDNAYGIYLAHYAFVAWVQYALLRSSLPAFVKGIGALIGALALSWITVGALRRIPAVRRVL